MAGEGKIKVSSKTPYFFGEQLLLKTHSTPVLAGSRPSAIHTVNILLWSAIILYATSSEIFIILPLEVLLEPFSLYSGAPVVCYKEKTEHTFSYTQG